MAVKLGIGGVVNLLDVAAQLGQITHRAEPNVQQQQQTGLMPGHLTHLTTDPGAHLVFEDAVARGAFSKKCNLTREIELINAGFGKWLAKEGYPLPPRTADVPWALPPPPPPVDEKGRQRKRGASAAVEPAKAEAGGEGAALAELQTQYMLQHRLAWRNEELSNWRAAASRPTPQPAPTPAPTPTPEPPPALALLLPLALTLSSRPRPLTRYVDTLPEAAWLMWRPGTEAPGAAGGEVQQCPLRSSWSTMLDKSGVWQYSVPGGKQGGPAQPTPVKPQQQKQQDLRQLMKSSATALDGVAVKAQLQVQRRASRTTSPSPDPNPKPRLRPRGLVHLRPSPQREGRGGSRRGLGPRPRPGRELQAEEEGEEDGEDYDEDYEEEEGQEEGEAPPQPLTLALHQAQTAKLQAAAAQKAAAAKAAKEKEQKEEAADQAAEFDKQGRPRLLPSFFLVGTPRSGTTVLYDSLTGNDPNIVPAMTKEVNDLTTPTPTPTPTPNPNPNPSPSPSPNQVNYFNSAGYESKPAKWYFSQFKRKKQPNQITGDGSCTSVLCPKVAARVHERAPSITRLLMCVRDEVRRVQSHYRMCKQNERVEIEGKPDGKKVTRPPNTNIKPLPPLAELIGAELRHIRKCDADMPNATLDLRFGTCYINPEATCKFSSALLPETLHTTNRPGCSTLLAASM